MASRSVPSMRQPGAVIGALCLMFGCGPLGDDTASKRGTGKHSAAARVSQDARIVVTERAAGGGRLIALSQTGQRLHEVTRIGPVPVRDNSPALSPDGRFVVFASSRGRQTLAETNLWIVPMSSRAPPRRLTRTTKSIDRDPGWTPDGAALLFSSNRAGDFDVWRLPMAFSPEHGVPLASGPPVALTDGPEHDFSPSAEPTGDRVVFMRADADGRRSRLWVLAGETASAITDGPTDMTPSWSPDGQSIAFAAVPSGGKQTDLYTVRPDGSAREPVVAEPLGNQSGPRWSTDGRFLFCTSLYRSVTSGKAVLSSVTFVDLQESPRVLRALQSRVAPESRMGPTIEPGALAAESLHRNRSYKQSLQYAVEVGIIQAFDDMEPVSGE